MSITAYFGVPGSGKSHECVKSVILPAYRQGRRIVTNIDGINPEAIREYALKLSKGKASTLGEIVKVTDEQVTQAGFFPYKRKEVEGYACEEAFCKPGDLICIDEAWKFWKSDKDLTYEHESFISEHRHFTDPVTGLCCDLVLMNQSPDTIARLIKGRIETSYKMTKLVMVGARNRYRVDVYSGVRLTKSNRTTYYQNKYDKPIFKLYHSYNGGKGNESVVDDRQNIFSQARLWVFIVGFLILAGVSGYLLYAFWTQYDNDKPVASDNQREAVPSSEGHSARLSSPKNEAQKETVKPVSAQWRISGILTIDNYAYVALVNAAGDIRLVNKNDFHGKGLMMFGFVDGEKVTYFSGVAK
ncbi:zonular occludens toxin family protein [Xenorhabdus bharatensis]|uniref:zonular occludens toxin family protein n=1 Tax=Xenorhabdus bharatensis TaxID=3136256 RepID=UPI0030F45956